MVSNKYSIKSLAIDPNQIQLKSGATKEFSCTALYDDGTERTFQPIWGVSSSLGTISQAGVFTATTVTITTDGFVTAAYGNLYATAVITVEPVITMITTEETSDFPFTFSISGNKILDEQGNEFIFRGINIMDPAWLDTVYFKITDEYFLNLASWEANIIRIPIHPSAYFYYGSEKYLGLIDRVLNLIATHKIYTILDFHSIGFPPEESYMERKDNSVPWGINNSIYIYTDSQIKSFWQEIASHYKDDKRIVFYELFNEPTNGVGLSEGQSWNNWKIKAEELIDIIRTYNPKSKIIVSGINYSYDVSFAVNNPINRENIVYGTHPYPNLTKSYDDAFGNLKAIYPIFATEFGFDPNAEGEHYQANAQYGTDIINYLENKKISWAVWNFSPYWNPTLILDWDYSYAPTISGTIFKSYLQSLN